MVRTSSEQDTYEEVRPPGVRGVSWLGNWPDQPIQP